VIPLYINLKGLRRDGRPINADLIEEFVKKTLREDINADVDRFLDEEFSRGLTEGTWLFLFDSFDEMPDVLGASRLDNIVRDYSEAIATFLAGMRPCRGVVASREFHSPKGLPWPRWQIKPLSGKRQRTLIHRYLVDREREAMLVAGLDTADVALARDASNPLFLSLLAEYVRQTDEFPASPHDVYEAYIGQRLALDSSRVEDRFGIDTAVVRREAEILAFAMSNSDDLGLEPTRGELIETLERPTAADVIQATTCMDVLEYLKLAQGQSGGPNPQGRVFTFSHRRFQEYFTTAAVLRGVGEVSANTVLSDARWRETAVTLCQLQREFATPLVAEATAILRASESTTDLDLEDMLTRVASGQVASPEEQVDDPWPPSSLETLGILQSGFASDPESLPTQLRELVGRVLIRVSWGGLTYDRAAAVGVVAVAPKPIFDAVIQGAFKSGSRVLTDEAYRQISRLRSLSPGFASEIRRGLLRMLADGTLRRDGLSTKTQLRRFDDPSALLRAYRLSVLAPVIDLAVTVAFGAYVLSIDPFALAAFIIVLALYSHATIYAVAAVLGGNAIRGLRSEGLAYTGTFARAYMALALTLHPPHYHPRAPWFAYPLVCVAFAWAPLALLAIRRGRLMNVLICPLTAFASFAILWRRLQRVDWREFRSDIPELLLAAFAAAASILGMVLLTQAGEPYQSVILSLLFGASLLFIMIRRHARWKRSIADALWYRQWSTGHLDEFSLERLLDLLATIRTTQIVTRVLADLRVRSLIPPHDDIYAFLADFAHVVQLNSPSEIPELGRRTPGLREWANRTRFLQYPRTPSQQRDLEDEIARMVRALRDRGPASHAVAATTLAAAGR
jgi:hypothetical protein